MYQFSTDGVLVTKQGGKEHAWIGFGEDLNHLYFNPWEPEVHAYHLCLPWTKTIKHFSSSQTDSLY